MEIINDNGNTQFEVEENAGGDGQVYIYDRNGVGKIVLDTNGDSSFIGGNLGVGLNNPTFTFEVESALIGAVNLADTLYVDGNSDKVGIGTTLPDAIFEIQDDDTETELFAISSSSVGDLLLVNNVGQLVIGSTSAKTAAKIETWNGGFAIIRDDSGTPNFRIKDNDGVDIDNSWLMQVNPTTGLLTFRDETNSKSLGTRFVYTFTKSKQKSLPRLGR